ncbi:hypothetical protein GCM10010193_06810 [Kitasatospora atroaurantiaca]
MGWVHPGWSLGIHPQTRGAEPVPRAQLPCVIRTLPRLLAAPDSKPVPLPSTADVLRALARELAPGRRPWTPETASFIAGQFDGLAAAWDATRATGRDDPLRDAPAPRGAASGRAVSGGGLQHRT